MFLTTSIGIAFYTGGAIDPDILLRNADTALHHAKVQGKHRTEVFHTSMHQEVAAHLQTATDLQHVFERSELRLHYQPIINLETRRIIGFETLVRWQHPWRGLLAPGVFLDIVAEMGLQVQLCQWVLQTACQQLRQWQQHIPQASLLSVSINLGSQELQYPGFLAAVDDVLAQTNLDSTSLKIELTEGVLMPYNSTITHVLTELYERSIDVYLDDFGTGYSSLSYLHRFPIRTLKIDRSFVAHMDGTQSSELVLVHTIINLARNLHMDVIAEGVETHRQMQMLQELGCRYAQGFYLAAPLAVDAATDLLLQYAELPVQV